MQKDFVPLSAAVRAVPDAVSSIVDAVALVAPRLATVVTTQGSIKSDPLRELLGPVLSPFAITPGGQASFAAKGIDFTGPDQRIGVALQAGRAFANNGAIMSVLASASSPDIDWMVVVVPEIYKSSRVYPRVLDQLHDLQGAHGIHLDLQGVILLSY
ncbi:hypothetical protein [Promicromonospora soli]|uniref:Uncharacterized protein n=1 Tax=Promicromonospora soli TaxID=2035533 RepID=A0A919FRF4_9MICO|nr:hypothetical protein [Promicromonospora soli]GHH71060.1 hypothetical protein GCM10017772_18740 [Promicromonospora soli]